MATGDTKLSICSDALITLGASPLASFEEGTDSAQICDRLYDDLRDLLLVSFPWSFTLKKVQLARLVDAPASEWKYAYALPADILSSGPRALFNSSTAGARQVTEGWEVYEGNVLTDLTEVHIDYQFQPTEAVMPRYFVQLLKYYVAWHIAEPVTDQISKAEYWQSVAVGAPSENMRGGYFRQAMNIDSQTSPPQQLQNFEIIDVRH